MTERTKTRIGLLMGDPSGIGPELAVKLLADEENRQQAHVVVIGDPAVWERGMQDAGVAVPYQTVTELPDGWPYHGAQTDGTGIYLLHALDVDDAVRQGEASAGGGRFALDSSRVALELAQAGRIDGVCFAPFNKQAMHLAGSPFEDDLRYFAHVLEYEAYVGELNVMGDLWSARVTSHVPLKDVTEHITAEAIENAVRLAVRSLLSAGIERPKIAVAALNPHAGEGGLFGSEEIDLINPVVERLASETSSCEISGTYPSDTVFLKARDGEFDAVVTMYHDQGQVAMKLMGFSKGVTVHGGLPVVVTTPAHGTAFDIVGTGKADPGAITAAFQLACQMAVKN